MNLSEFTLNDFNDILSVQAEMSDKKGWFFLDEIQNIEGWEKFARRMADSKEHTFITGSNAKMLSAEIETRLGGRYLTKYITPFNFREFLKAKNIDYSDKTILATKSSGKIKREMENYFYFVAFRRPLIIRISGNMHQAYIRKFFWEILQPETEFVI